MDNTSLLISIGLIVIVCYVFLFWRICKIENAVEEIKSRTPFVPCGVHKHQDILIGTCPQCRGKVTNTDNAYECNNCFQRLDWNTNKKGEVHENN